jgi:hypothetical protein
MGIGSWFKKFRKREDDDAIHRAEERGFETRGERYATSGDIEGVRADSQAGRYVHEGNIDDVERLSR